MQSGEIRPKITSRLVLSIVDFTKRFRRGEAVRCLPPGRSVRLSPRQFTQLQSVLQADHGLWAFVTNRIR